MIKFQYQNEGRGMWHVTWVQSGKQRDVWAQGSKKEATEEALIAGLAIAIMNRDDLTIEYCEKKLGRR